MSHHREPRHSSQSHAADAAAAADAARDGR